MASNINDLWDAQMLYFMDQIAEIGVATSWAMVDHFKFNGYVTEILDEAGKQVKKVRLTEKGEKRREELRTYVESLRKTT